MIKHIHITMRILKVLSSSSFYEEFNLGGSSIILSSISGQDGFSLSEHYKK